MGPGRLRLGSDWLRACHVMSRSRTSMTPLAQRTLRCAAGQCGGRTSMGKRLVPVSGSFRLPVLPSVEWEWEWRAVAAACGPVRAAGHPPSRAAEQSRAERERERELCPRETRSGSTMAADGQGVGGTRPASIGAITSTASALMTGSPDYHPGRECRRRAWRWLFGRGQD